MKKAIYTAAIATTVLLTSSCSSGWNCKARYVKSDTVKKKETHRIA